MWCGKLLLLSALHCCLVCVSVLTSTLISWIASCSDSHQRHTCSVQYRLTMFQVGRIEMQFVHFARGQQKFHSFGFHKWLLTREKSLSKIANHTVQCSLVHAKVIS